jgi:hypothetical protein
MCEIALIEYWNEVNERIVIRTDLDLERAKSSSMKNAYENKQLLKLIVTFLVKSNCKVLVISSVSMSRVWPII